MFPVVLKPVHLLLFYASVRMLLSPPVLISCGVSMLSVCLFVCLFVCFYFLHCCQETSGVKMDCCMIHYDEGQKRKLRRSIKSLILSRENK
jgi:hypothetical protein